MAIEVKPILHVNRKEDSFEKSEIKSVEKSPGKTAVIICHGMGQQLKFETLSFVSDIILKQERKNNEGSDSEASVRLIDYEGSKIPRAELTIKDNEGSDRDIHLYEVYWAPVTEGKITAWQTMEFLLKAAVKGIRYSIQGFFERRIFGTKRKLKVQWYTSIIISIVLALLITLTLLFFLNMYILAVSIISWIYGFDSQIIVMPVVRIFPLSLFVDSIEKYYKTFLVINLIMGAALFKGKGILKQYVGDVVAYISPFKLSRFAVIRAEIQKLGFELANFVYNLKKSKSENTFEYDRIIFMGHSLGSILAYDTLNGVINENMNTDGESSAAERTKVLLTFGSVLDKTAFLFRAQADKLPVREALAEATQPLISNYKYRPDEWINIFSFMDIISGYLDYYDDPDMEENSPEGKLYWNKRIRNISDWSCWIPFAAHNQYWKKKKLADELMKALKK